MLANAPIRVEPVRQGYVPRGQLAAIDLHGCDRQPIDADRAAAVAVAHFGGTPTLRVLRR
jgi:hypothetical protein